MRDRVVYDSFFGNTEQVAQAIGHALSPKREVDIVRVSQNLSLEPASLELLIVGSPTRGFRPSESIMSFLRALPPESLRGLKVAAFDTRLSLDDIKSSAVRLFVRIGGYAAKPIADLLRSKGGEVLVPPEGFLVRGERGPLKDGELQRAADWARQIEEALHAPADST